MLEADKLRRYTIDPSKHLQFNLHNLAILVQTVNETSKFEFPESSMRAITHEAISKESREELGMIATNSSWDKQ